MKSAKSSRLACQKKSYRGILPRTRVGDSHHWEVTAERLDILRDADLIVRQEINRHGNQLWQAFAVLLPIRSVVLWATSAPTLTRLYCAWFLVKMATADWARSLICWKLFPTVLSTKFAASTGGLRYYV